MKHLFSNILSEPGCPPFVRIHESSQMVRGLVVVLSKKSRIKVLDQNVMYKIIDACASNETISVRHHITGIKITRAASSFDIVLDDILPFYISPTRERIRNYYRDSIQFRARVDYNKILKQQVTAIAGCKL